MQCLITYKTLQAVETVTYLGSTLAEINNRICKGSSTFGRLRVNVWEERGIGLETKLKVYSAPSSSPSFSTALKPGWHIDVMKNN